MNKMRSSLQYQFPSVGCQATGTPSLLAVEGGAGKDCSRSSGKMEFDDDKAAAHPNGKFEVDDATCQDGKKYDLTFDPNYKVLTKKLD